MAHSVDGTPLGKDTAYPDAYDASLLCPIPRSEGRAHLIKSSGLPFSGVDFWNAYEFSWLNAKGKPVVGILQLAVPCESPNIVESKSLKLYFNSLNQHRFPDQQTLESTVSEDLKKVVGSDVTIRLTTNLGAADDYQVSTLTGECVDGLDVEVGEFDLDSSILASDSSGIPVSETLCSHLLRSNCPVTSQPDWASVFIRYAGPKIDRESLLRYIISYRTHNEFHEQCVERMFVDLMAECKLEKLTVYARYTRRGGIDINPFRSNFEEPYNNVRLVRQ